MRPPLGGTRGSEEATLSATDDNASAHREAVTVFGGTGFLGRRIARRFAAAGHPVRAASRHPDREVSDPDPDMIAQVKADINEPGSLREALSGGGIVVNAVSLYRERGGTTFHSVHVAGAERVAEEAARVGAKALVHISGIGANRHAGDAYVRSRGEGEDAVRRAFPQAVIIRPSVMFATGDAFLATLAELTRLMPVLPLFGRGETRLQPVHADDVASAVVCAATDEQHHGQVHHAAGPAIYTYRQLVELVMRETGSRAVLLPFPFALWQLTAAVAELLPNPPVTRGQVALMEGDNTADNSPIFAACGIERRRVEATLKEIVAQRR